MKIAAILTVLSMFVYLPNIKADDNVPITPKPLSVTRGAGTFAFPKRCKVAYGKLPDSLAVEAKRFVANFNATTGYNTVATSAKNGNVTLLLCDTTGIGVEGYRLEVKPSGITLRAHTSAGFFYGFQSLKFLLPLNVMAGVREASVTAYTVPEVSIIDRPRFGYRGFMLDVSRHFFSLNELKRMLDLMACYKMNRFHWHLTDDQGWRIEIKKYPKLTSVGSIRDNSFNVDPVRGRYQINAPYGPYFYTQAEARELVAYARERHIEVIPEVDMPGHFCAAMASYPEYSCTPDGAHAVQTDGGIFADVLNVANPQAVQFAKDILDELVDIFPYPQIHIGGDECPTSAWKANAECVARTKTLGLGDNFRALQSHFIKEMADYMGGKADASKRRRLLVWNESISAEGAQTDLIRQAGATVMCWYPCDASALQAATLGMDNIVTPYGPYYINRKQSTEASEPYGAGNGNDNLERTYAYVPVPKTVTPEQAAHYKGVQATFWTEHVSSNYLLEYLALPRLAAVAESAWTAQSLKNFDNFRQRIQRDSTLYNYGRYAYGRHYMQSFLKKTSLH